MMRTGRESGSVPGGLRSGAEGLFYLLLAFMPFAYGTVEGWSLAVSHLLVYGILACYLAGRLAAGRPDFHFPALTVLLTLLLSWSILSTWLFSVYRYPGLQFALKLTDYLLVAFYLYHSLSEDPARCRRLAAVIVLTGTAVATWGLIRYLGRPLSPGESGPAGASGPFVNHNHFAGYLELCLCVAAGLFLAGYRRVRPELMVLQALAILLIFTALLFSLSRGGIIATLAGGLLLTAAFLRHGRGRSRRRRSEVLPLTILTVALLGFAALLETDRLEARLKSLATEGRERETLNSRTYAWQSAWQAIRVRPVTGYGPGAFAEAILPYRTPGTMFRFRNAHNDYLQAWVELGLPGLALAALGLGLFLRRLRAVLDRETGRADWIALGAGAGVLVLLLHSLVDFNLQLHANALLFVVLATMLSLPRHAVRERRETSRRVAAPWLALALALPLLAGGSWLSWRLLRADRLERRARELAAVAPARAQGLYAAAFRNMPLDADCALGAARAYALNAERSGIAFFRARAREYLDRAIALRPGDSEALLARAWLSVAGGDRPAAERDFRAAIERDPRNPACHFYFSDYLLERGRLKEAARASRQGLALAPEFFGRRLSALGGLSSDPHLLGLLVPEEFGRGHFLLARYLLEQGRPAGALQALDRCDQATRRESGYQLLRGSVLLGLGRLPEAEASFRRGTELRPLQVYNYRELARLLVRQGRHPEVEQLFAAALATVPERRRGAIRFEHALYLRDRGDYPALRWELHQALRDDLNNTDCLELLADSFLAEQRFEEALGELRRIERLEPGRTSVLRKLAAAHAALGQHPQARQYCRRVLELAPDDRFALNLIQRIEAGATGAGGSDGV